MDEENFFWSEPLNVDAIVANDGDEFLYNADADAQGDENFYGQNQSLAGDGGWWDDNYPGQTVQNPDTVSDTGISVVLPGGSLQFENSAQYEAWSTNPQEFAVSNIGGVNTVVPYPQVATSISPTQVLDPYSGPTTQKSLSALTARAATPTQDAYGLTILNAAQTQQLTRNINPAFINSVVDPNARTKGIYVDAEGVAFDSATGLSLPVNSQGRQVLPADVAITPGQQLRINQFNSTPTNLSPTAVDDPEVGPRTEYRQTVAEAARLNSYSETPNPFLTEIDKAGANIAEGTAGIAKSKENIQTAQQYIVDAESYIAQNNTELANPDISAERRAELEANNAENAQIIFDANQNITNQETYIAQTQDTIQLSEASINENAAVYRDTTNPANTTTVDINTDPSIGLVDRVRSLFSGQPTTNAAPVNVQDGQAFGPVFPDPTGNGGFVDVTGNPVTADGTPIFPAARFTTADQDSAIQTQVGRLLAQQQAVTAAQKKTVNNGDWRVRLSLAKGANYLYNGADPGILAPLRTTGGVIFPYTPQIEMSYKADYESYALTHSNYKGYFYKSSSVDAVNMSATFTAQDSAEADYLLAVIHFFRSVTKMFYGKDPQRGAPPPLVYLTGLGQYQFNGQPCVVTSFNYNLPRDIDYIRARSTNINGTNLLTRRNRQDLPTNPISGAVARLQNLFSGQGISYGAERNRPQPPTLGQNQPTYVPTKLDITLSLLPVQSRSQVTNQFSVADYASGALLKGGFW
jgi:hypothetical protein